MNSLKDYGLLPTDTVTALLHDVDNNIDQEKFFKDAEELLLKLGDVVRSEVIPNLEQYDGRWHPSGFMVYALGAHPELGSLRFHIWPKNLRRRLIKGRGEMNDIYDGDIHNHAWNITSLVMEYYSDNFYDIKTVDEGNLTDKEVNDKGLYRVFNVRYGEDARQGLMTDGKVVEAVITKQREARKGDIHTIDTSIFHAPTIPVDVLGSTLVFDSFRLHANGPDILIGGTTDPIFDARREVSKEDAILAKNQLLASE